MFYVAERVYITEASKDDMRLEMSQYLIGCKAAAEISHLNSVYGIVTNYTQSNFLHSLDEKIGLDECVVDMDTTGPSTDYLVDITAKIYTILSDE